MKVRCVSKGHYSDHGLGSEMEWKPPVTIIEAPDGDCVEVTAAGTEARVRYRYVAGGSMDFTRHSPFTDDHDELVQHWIDKLTRFKAELVG